MTIEAELAKINAIVSLAERGDGEERMIAGHVVQRVLIRIEEDTDDPAVLARVRDVRSDMLQRLNMQPELAPSVAFTLRIRSDSAAMVEDTEGEVARLLRRTADQVESGVVTGTLLDINGNKVGSWALETA